MEIPVRDVAERPLVGLIWPSRGLMHSRNVEATLAMVDSYGASKVKIYFAHGLTLPECFNAPIQRALDEGVEYILIVEDDVLMPADALGKLVAAIDEGYAIAFYDYPMSPTVPVTANIGGYLTSGTGCTMFSREVMEKIGPFDTSTLRLKSGEVVKHLTEEEQLNHVTGNHDIDFYIRAQQADYKVKEVGKAIHEQYRGKKRTNNSAYDIIRLEY